MKKKKREREKGVRTLNLDPKIKSRPSILTGKKS